MNKTVQYFSDEYLEHCKKMSKTEIIEFLDNYQKLLFAPGELKQVNVRIPVNLLNAFKAKSKREGVLYQRKIKELMSEWVFS